MRGERGDGAWVRAGAEVVGGCAGGVDAGDVWGVGVVGVRGEVLVVVVVRWWRMEAARGERPVLGGGC